MSDAPAALSVRGVAKSFGATQALSPFDLDVPAGSVHALLGENGSGKSTLIKILSGYHRPDRGEVLIGGDPLVPGSAHSSHALGARFVHQDLGLVATESVLDNLCAGSRYATRFGTIRGRVARASAARDLARVGLDVDPRRPVGSLPPAQQTAVAVARALRDDPDSRPRLLVLDEPTARLPEREVEQLLATVRSVAAAGIAVVYVSHRIDEVFAVADTVTVLRDGRKIATRPVAELDRRSLVELLVGEVEDVHPSDRPAPSDAPPRLLVAGLRAADLRDVSFSAAAGEVVGIAGITGSGRESLLATVFGGVERWAGTVTVDGHRVPAGRPDLAIAAGAAFLPPDRAVGGGIMSHSARENLTIAHLLPHWRPPRLSRRREAAECRTWFDRLSVRPADDVERPLSAFSGGNQQKVLFGKWLRIGPAVLLLDEPTQGVDVGTKAELHREILAAAAAGAGVVVSSSDNEELLTVCHRILVFRGGAVVADLTGDSMTVASLSHASFGTDAETSTPATAGASA